MAKKRKGRGKSSSVDGAKATPKLKDPDPNSADYMYDKMDMFHLNKDKILLDPNADKDDEEELEENLDEEVLALEGGSSEEEEEEEEDEEGDDEDEVEEGDEEDDEGDDDDEDGMFEDSDNEDDVNDKAWGKSKKQFYNTDVQDDDIYASDEEAELAAEEEEKEAMVLQKRLAEKLDAEDFYTFDENDEIEESEEKAVKKVKVDKDLSKLSKRERLEILAEESPELLPLLDEYKEKMEVLQERYHPLLLLVRNGFITNEEGAKFIETKHQLLLNYLVNISFYLALKSTKGERTKGHPVINILVQHQQLFSIMKPAEEKLEDEITHFLDTYKVEIQNGTLETNNVETKGAEDAFEKMMQPTTALKEEGIKKAQKSNQLEPSMDPLEYYNMVKANTRAKKAKKQKLDEDIVEDGGNEAEEETEEGGKRMITYEMSKNKGLIRNRRKELKNPRVKHKMKFKKAIVKRKGVVREVQREVNRYGGETTGITAMLSRSTKIK